MPGKPGERLPSPAAMRRRERAGAAYDSRVMPVRALSRPRVALFRTRGPVLMLLLVAGFLSPRAEETQQQQPSQPQSPPSVGASTVSATPLPEHRAAVAIRNPLPVPPIEAAGTGLTPLVAVRLTVDERGRVAGIDLNGFQPSTAYDAFYEREVRKALSGWRFAPAIENGAPVSAVLEWKIRFEPKESKVSVPDELSLQQDSWRTFSGIADDESSGAWARYVVSLTIPERRKVLGDLRQRAEKHFSHDKITEVHRGPYVVLTDFSEETAKAIVQNLGVADGVLHGLFDGAIPPQPEDDLLYTYVYAKRKSFDGFRVERAMEPFVDGFYVPPGVIAIHLELSSGRDVLSLLLHEFVHAYLDRIVVKPGVDIPLWIGEGLAEYMAHSDIKNGRIVPGGHKQHLVFYRNPMMSWVGTSASRFDAEEVKGAIASGKAIPVADLVTAQRNIFYGDKARLYYSEAWMLVHFLIKGRPTWAAEQFPRFLLLIAEGYPPAASFKEAYGKDPAAMGEEFRTYVRKF